MLLAKKMSSGRIYKFLFRKEQPQWLWDMALEVRLPALFLLGVVYVNTKCYCDSLTAYQAGSRWGITQGKLLELRKLNYRYIIVPRYAVKYEFEVDGKQYVSTRGTTGSPYRNWMEGWYYDTITEAEYLQAIPVLRVGERCSVFYDKKNPKAHSALAQDANSFEISFLGFLAVFPLLMGHYMKAHFWMLRKAYMPNRKMRIRFPVYDHPKPPPSPPKEPQQISQLPPRN
ncbi:conserved hypothetical protein [Leishmania major strain Friedlin]|uniref:DUF3592 domain-containing protein n=1 Tax=Leishmania major TaxID=5664 RepID=Q4QAX1_LEIMA|nr:conserved hypothetical protein [Leishmania major strain Friedlin]CAG9574476.1 hypothetical_protein_-_conserved [Leishmania major strain Friedlin]CAJ03938.1 conserved hypothetical protein [Leishmania major strain Friedlin]|eukprot:XP_001683527.1 conserved hypothetical protein [Leishmania major strain Friedlin]